jgi:hypothetical protein
MCSAGDQETDLESLLVMTDETLSSVVEKAGPRARLFARLAEVC